MYVSPRANYRSASSTDSLIWVSVPLLYACTPNACSR